MKPQWYLPNSQIQKRSEFTWVLPSMRVNASTLWDLAERMANLWKRPVQVLDADQRPIERGRETGLSDSQAAVVTVTTRPPLNPDGSTVSAGPELMVTFAASGGSVALSGTIEHIRNLVSDVDGLVNWLVAEASYRWGRTPFAIGGVIVIGLAVVVSAIAALVLVFRGGHAVVLMPLLLAGIAVVAGVLGQWGRALIRRQLDRARGQLVDRRPREQVALARENNRANLRAGLIGAALTLGTGLVGWLAQELWQLLHH